MSTEYPVWYRAEKCSGRWYVVNSEDSSKIACDCRNQAEEFAAVLNEPHTPSGARLSAMTSQLARGPVFTKPFDAPSDEVHVYPQESDHATQA